MREEPDAMGHKCSNEEAIARTLAGKAFSLAVDAAPFRAQEGRPRYPMTLAIPAARIVMGDDAPATVDTFLRSLKEMNRLGAEHDDMPPFADAQGHVRPVYDLLCLHLHLTALAYQRDKLQEAECEDGCRRYADMMRPIQLLRQKEDGGEALPGQTVATRLWRALCELEWALLRGEVFEGAQALTQVQIIQDTPAQNGALHAQSPDDTPDAWTYRELTGLHALDLATRITSNAGWHVRCRQIAAHHHAHTQPDYTTYQPWALATFAEDETTSLFAQQQLHDVQSHLSLSGEGGALIPALLLADAIGQMSGATQKVWGRYKFS